MDKKTAWEVRRCSFLWELSSRMFGTGLSIAEYKPEEIRSGDVSLGAIGLLAAITCLMFTVYLSCCFEIS